MTKKSKRWIDDDYGDEYVTDKKRQKKFKDRRKNKRMKNAIRSLDISEIQDMEERVEDYY